MPRFYHILPIIFFIFFNAFSVSGQGFFKAKGKEIVNGNDEPVILRGIGLGGWMLQEGYLLGIYKEGQQYRIRERIDSLIGPAKTQEFYDAWLANHTTKADIDSMKVWGFNSIRLPMHYNLYTLPIEKETVKGKNTWLEKGFAMTDSLVSWCKENGMYLILDLHAAPGGQGNDLNISDRDPKLPSLWDSPDNQQKTIALWKKIAEHYANETTIIAYDIINEPNWGFQDAVNDKNGLKEQKNEPLKKLLKDITRAIREVDKRHLIIIEGNGWGNNYNGILEDGLWDDNMALSFHKYWNFNDAASIKSMLDMRDKYNVPVWLGETGENSNVWFTEAIKLLEENNIGWAWWPLKKKGINNPLQIVTDSNYDLLVKHWNGEKVDLPSKEAIYQSLISFAEFSNNKNNIVHRDVVDAMIRQPFTDDVKAFRMHILHKELFMQAVNYDYGKNGIAYFDTDLANYRVSGQDGKGNYGGAFRNDGVDIYREEKGDLYVGKIETGEWLQYTIIVFRPGIFEVKLNVAAPENGGLISISDINNSFTKSTVIDATGSWEHWKVIKLGEVELRQGMNHIRIKADEGGFNLKEIFFKSVE